MANGVAFLDPFEDWPWLSRDSVSACAASYFLMLTGALENVNGNAIYVALTRAKRGAMLIKV